VSQFVVPLRAIGATIAFTVAGLAGLLLAPQPWAAKAPNAAFYAVLVVNTFFSVRFFDALPPQGRDERVIDAILAITYLALAATMGGQFWFGLASTSLFAAAVAKYVLLLRVMDRRAVLVRKIKIDALGVVLCATATAGALLWDRLATAWAQTIVFAIANVYLLAVNPMYVDIAAPAPPPGYGEKKEARQAAPPR
jgi:hypothetical protein